MPTRSNRNGAMSGFSYVAAKAMEHNRRKEERNEYVSPSKFKVENHEPIDMLGELRAETFDSADSDLNSLHMIGTFESLPETSVNSIDDRDEETMPQTGLGKVFTDSLRVGTKRAEDMNDMEEMMEDTEPIRRFNYNENDTSIKSDTDTKRVYPYNMNDVTDVSSNNSYEGLDRNEYALEDVTDDLGEYSTISGVTKNSRMNNDISREEAYDVSSEELQNDPQDRPTTPERVYEYHELQKNPNTRFKTTPQIKSKGDPRPGSKGMSKKSRDSKNVARKSQTSSEESYNFEVLQNDSNRSRRSNAQNVARKSKTSEDPYQLQNDSNRSRRGVPQSDASVSSSQGEGYKYGMFKNRKFTFPNHPKGGNSLSAKRLKNRKVQVQKEPSFDEDSTWNEDGEDESPQPQLIHKKNSNHGKKNTAQNRKVQKEPSFDEDSSWHEDESFKPQPIPKKNSSHSMKNMKNTNHNRKTQKEASFDDDTTWNEDESFQPVSNSRVNSKKKPNRGKQTNGRPRPSHEDRNFVPYQGSFEEPFPLDVDTIEGDSEGLEDGQSYAHTLEGGTSYAPTLEDGQSYAHTAMTGSIGGSYASLEEKDLLDTIHDVIVQHKTVKGCFREVFNCIGVGDIFEEDSFDIVPTGGTANITKSKFVKRGRKKR